MTDFVQGLPKAELHLHIEGTLEPELLFALAGKNGVTVPYRSVEEVRAAYDFGNLQDFLDLYYQGMAVLRTAADFATLTRAYLDRARDDGVRHAEIFFDPQGHTSRGVPFEAVLEGIDDALRNHAPGLGISTRLILCFLRDRPVDEAMATLAAALPHRDRIVAVGLDSAERGHPPEPFRPVFERARAAGLLTVAHAGEEGPPAHIHGALEALGARRIDHGIAAMEDPALLRRLAAEKVPLTVCPLSNVKLRVVDDLADHPLRAMLAAGVVVTVNSDDPAYFGGYIAENYRASAAALGLDRDDLVRLARNSFEAAFLTDAEKRAHLAAIDAYAAADGR